MTRSESPILSIIRKRITSSPIQAISFRDYMEICLYEPEFGYYTSSRNKVGKTGDFYTSSAIGGIMGEMVGDYILKWQKDRSELDPGFELVEWGGGTGQMALQILDRIHKKAPLIYDQMQYIVIERSEYHRDQQRIRLQGHLNRVQFMSPEQWRLSGNRTNSVIFSNELLDAFPVYRVRKRGQHVYEIYVGWDEHNQRLAEKEILCESPQIKDYMEKEKVNLLEGQTIEINLAASQWIGDLAEWLEKGMLITIDYGDVSEELYAAHRMQGTLLCYRNHQAYDDPYAAPGEQDMTAHVNFSACIRAGEKAGIQDWRFITQRDFLVEAGILSELQDHDSRDPFSPQAKRNRAIRQLLISDQMSELFKVLLQKKQSS